MLAIELKPKLEAKLTKFAKKIGVSESELARKAINEYLEDLQDYNDAVAADRDGGPYISSTEIKRDLGL